MIQFTRRDPSDNSTETLTLVRLDSDGSLAIQIETGTPETWKKDPNDRQFVGLYDLDGDALSLGNDEWEIAEDQVFRSKDAVALREACGIEGDGDLPAAEVLEPLMQNWESGNSVCERAA